METPTARMPAPIPLADFLAAAGAGWTATEIALAFDRSDASVRQRARRNGIRLASPRGWMGDAVVRLLVAHAEGATLAEVADELGVSTRKVGRKVRALGLSFPRGPRPDAARRSQVVALVSVGHDTGGKLAAALGVHRTTANRLVFGLVADGLLRRVGVGRGRRLRTGRVWNEPDEREYK